MNFKLRLCTAVAAVLLAGNVLAHDLETEEQQLGYIIGMDIGKSLRDQGTEIDLGIAALIPEDYLPDVHQRLILYKRIASANNKDELRELQVEMIDRFGLLPVPLKNLIAVTELKLKATPMGLLKIDLGEDGGRIVFNKEPNIDLMQVVQLVQTQANFYKFDGANKLRITKPLPTIEKRFEEINRLLDSFSSPQ